MPALVGDLAATHDCDGDRPVWIDGASLGAGALLCLPLAAEGRRFLAVIGYDEAPADHATVEAGARALQPTLAAFVRLWRRSRAERRRTAGLSDALDQNEVAVLVLNADGGVSFANRAARDLLDRNDGLRLNQRSVMPTSLRDAVRFQMSVDHVVARGHGEPPSTGAQRAIVLLIERGGGKRPLIATVMATRTPPGEPGDPAAVIYAIRPEHDNSRFLVPICQLHGLSPVETRLVCGLVSGQTISEAAATMHIKPDTARAYLKQVFLKTGTHRQTDLVRLMMRNLVPVTAETIPETGF